MPCRLDNDDDFDNAFMLARLVELRAVQEQDGVGILLDGARFAQVAEAGTVVLAVFRATVDLGQGDNGYLQLVGAYDIRAHPSLRSPAPVLHRLDGS